MVADLTVDVPKHGKQRVGWGSKVLSETTILAY